MALCGGSASKNPVIEADLKKNRDALKKDIKVLLLGAGESGKSTIFKQLKIMNQQGLTLEERSSFKEIIFGNIVKNMKSLVTASMNLDLPVEEEENRSRVEAFNSLDNEALVNVSKLWDSKMISDIKTLWADAGIKKVFERRNEFQLDDSAPYYFNDIDRIAASDYIPTEEDVLRTRVKTTGIVETNVTLNNQSVKVIDVGGQRNERKKWIHCFEGVTAIIFVASLSEFDQKCYEDDHTNRMMEALLLFDEICNSRWFGETSVILFLNKLDLFREKIRIKDLNVCFKEYDGGCNYDKAIDFIKLKFEEKNRRKELKQIYMHLTCATNTGQIQMVFNNIKDIILQRGMKDNGLM